MLRLSWVVRMHSNCTSQWDVRVAVQLVLLLLFLAQYGFAENLNAFIHLEDGRQLTAKEVEYVLSAEDIGAEYDLISDKIRKAGNAAIPLYRDVLEFSTRSTAVAVALRGLQRMCEDPELCSGFLSTIAERDGMMKLPNVRSAIIHFVAENGLASRLDLIEPFLVDGNKNIRFSAFLCLAQLGNQDTLSLLDESAQELRQQDYAELEKQGARLRSTIENAGLEFDSIKKRDQEWIESRHREMEGALQELRTRLASSSEPDGANESQAVIASSANTGREAIHPGEDGVERNDREFSESTKVTEDQRGAIVIGVLLVAAVLVLFMYARRAKKR